ncbi:hypothetical protein BDB00DRAFT_874256 [Zychaea mexicana]|uniref:uncharacterized protein n=1 Tax=Zychaea mexicana TaxID=64656 RepID=UPI0022FE927D|nr:uncharacterized protein BDB00DRAFT_874256 [Zychaea mexicana]KAI9491526.1 hypothetical protein BDB00DRAFT_874256 [Zychaea mexicana]
MAGAAGAGGLAVATYNNIKNRQPKVEEQPVDPATFEDQQYYGNLAIGPSSPTHAIADNHDNNRVQAGQQEQYDPYRPSPHASWLSQASAIDPFGTAAAYNYATQLHQASAATSSVERPPVLLAPPEDNTVPAGGGGGGGGAYVPALARTIHDQSRQSPEMDAFGGNGGGGARWQQGSETGARASGITATIDASSVSNDSSTSNTTDESKQQRPQHIQTDSGDTNNKNKGRMLWDDALASAGCTTVARSASTASTNPFRSSMSNPRDSGISALRISPIPEDAWSLEDHAAMPSDDNPVAAIEGNNNSIDTSPTMQQQHHPKPVHRNNTSQI